MTRNLIIELTRDIASDDAWGDTMETLYALHRLWNEYQTPDMGTSPIDAWDAGDECYTYDYIAPELHDMPPGDASRLIAHATRVMMRYADLLRANGHS